MDISEDPNENISKVKYIKPTNYLPRKEEPNVISEVPIE
jgi:hypothetical protein